MKSNTLSLKTLVSKLEFVKKTENLQFFSIKSAEKSP